MSLCRRRDHVTEPRDVHGHGSGARVGRKLGKRQVGRAGAGHDEPERRLGERHTIRCNPNASRMIFSGSGGIA